MVSIEWGKCPTILRLGSANFYVQTTKIIGKLLIVYLAVTCALAEKPGLLPAPVHYKPYPPPPPPPTTTTTIPPPPPPAYKPYQPYPPLPPPPDNYAYSYAVLDEETSLDIAADELAENGAVSGSYKVVLPDGRIKTVTYTVEGDSRFVADVLFETTPAPAADAPVPYPKYNPYPA
nr:cuticle protein 19.8-like [Lepeophtheirus salmonis]